MEGPASLSWRPTPLPSRVPMSQRARLPRLVIVEVEIWRSELMQQRIDPRQLVPDLMGAMVALEQGVAEAGLEPRLRHLVKTRASQINGCAFCIHMHTREARSTGESEERLYLLSAWRESPLYSERERAALAWTEAVTKIAETGAPAADYELLRRHFTEKEAAALTFLIATINAWNRLAIAFRTLHPMKREAA